MRNRSAAVAAKRGKRGSGGGAGRISWFAAAFWLHAAEEHYASIHAIRLCAFWMIIAAIVNKNRSRGDSSR